MESSIGCLCLLHTSVPSVSLFLPEIWSREPSLLTVAMPTTTYWSPHSGKGLSLQLSEHGTKFVILYFYLFIYYGCSGSSLLKELFSSCSKWGLFSTCGAWALHCGGFSWCRARALGHVGSEVAVCSSRAQAQWLWYMDLVALQCVGSSQTRDQTHISCIGRWIFRHWATREAPDLPFFLKHRPCP